MFETSPLVFSGLFLQCKMERGYFNPGCFN